MDVQASWIFRAFDELSITTNSHEPSVCEESEFTVREKSSGASLTTVTTVSHGARGDKGHPVFVKTRPE